MSDNAAVPFNSEAGYRAAIDATLALARREVRIFDRDLARMSLEVPARTVILEHFLSDAPHRRLRVVLHDTEVLERRSPRLMALLRHFGHLTEIRLTPDYLRHLADCLVLADERHAAVRFHADHARGKQLSASAQAVQPYWQRFDELWEASQPVSPGTTTGL